MASRKTSFIRLEITSKSTQELLGRQSVRTTFKLTERSIDAMSVLANQLGIKQKSLFDHLIDDDSVMKMIAEESTQYEIPEQRIAKTYVISRRTLQNLEKISSRYQTPRDALVELSIERILPLITEEKKKHKQRKIILQKLYKMVGEGEEIFEMANESLDKDDPVYRRIYQMAKTVRNCCDDVETFVDRGRKIEDF
ncbi:hypothetical protein [Desulfopila inferna]|uniref:hypothetical protein n=1 Tax=Desulfopila inferna TaxID=468528 RepID=UPI001966C888|nr:hypothetical protein [Desulfopila inferna]MBM9606102.1 hypothetical protein [Desulfopila inferna]